MARKKDTDSDSDTFDWGDLPTVPLRDPHRRRAGLLKGPDFNTLHSIYSLDVPDTGIHKARKIKIKVPHVLFPDGTDRTIRFKVSKDRHEIRVECKSFPTIFILAGHEHEVTKGHWYVALDDQRRRYHPNPYTAFLYGLLEVWDFQIADLVTGLN